MLTLVYGIETLAVAPSPLGDSSKAGWSVRLSD